MILALKAFQLRSRNSKFLKPCKFSGPNNKKKGTMIIKKKISYGVQLSGVNRDHLSSAKYCSKNLDNSPYLSFSTLKKISTAQKNARLYKTIMVYYTEIANIIEWKLFLQPFALL